MVHITAALVEVLLDLAADAEPDSVSVVLASSPADSLSFADATADVPDSETPVLTHFYMPEAGHSVNKVFGVDLGTPAGRGRARFVSHPQRPRSLTKEDDLAAVVLLAVPPWESIAAFDRAGSRLDLTVLDATPPRESLV